MLSSVCLLYGQSIKSSNQQLPHYLVWQICSKPGHVLVAASESSESIEANFTVCIGQDMAKKDEGNAQKSDDETEKKAGSGEEGDEIEEEGYDEEDIEEVGLHARTLKWYC